MTYLEYYAGQALAGLAASSNPPGQEAPAPALVGSAKHLAYEMCEALEVAADDDIFIDEFVDIADNIALLTIALESRVGSVADILARRGD